MKNVFAKCKCCLTYHIGGCYLTDMLKIIKYDITNKSKYLQAVENCPCIDCIVSMICKDGCDLHREYFNQWSDNNDEC